MSWNNITIDATSQNTARFKRTPIDLMPNLISIRIKYENGEEITMNWTKETSYVANKYLRVLVSMANRELEVMDDVGMFVAYYDIMHCSAIVYFEKLNSFSGVIGTDYYMDNLPSVLDEMGIYRLGVVGNPYVKKRQSQLNHIRPENFFPSISIDNFPHLLNTFYEVNNDNQDNNSTISASFYNYFCETLIFVARDVANDFLGHFGPDHYIKWIVRYYIIYFHAVDMMFKTLFTSYGLIQINIAKICIETNTEPFSFLNKDTLRFSDITAELPNYLSISSEYYPEDSFDYIFIHTSRSIWDGPVRRFGVTKLGNDLIDARKNNQFYYAVPFTVMRHESFYADYLTTIHALGGVFGINIDSEDSGLTPTGQCHSVMQRSGPRCNYCLRWSEASKNQLSVFLRTNRNRCFLLNYPRSLGRPGPTKLYLPCMQCKCYGYDNYRVLPYRQSENGIPIAECATHLMCEQSINGVRVPKNTGIRPFDGTPCGSKKVCWNKMCTKT